MSALRVAIKRGLMCWLCSILRFEAARFALGLTGDRYINAELRTLQYAPVLGA